MRRRDGTRVHMSERLKNVVTAILVSLPILVALSLVLNYGIDVPFMDDWDQILFIGDFVNGRMTIGKLGAHHCEHRPIVQRCFRLAAVYLGGWNLRHEMLLSLFLNAAALAALFMQIRSICSLMGSSSWRVLVILSSLLLFSPVQFENFLWRLQTGWFFANLTVVGGIILVCRGARSPWYYVGAVFLGIAGSFSQAQALVFWPIGALCILLSPDEPHRLRSRKLARLGIWILVSVLVVGTYLQGLPFGVLHADGHTLGEWLRLLKYTTMLLGSPVGRMDVPLTIALGGVGFLTMAILALAWLRSLMKNPVTYSALMPWLALSLYPLCSFVMITLARARFGMDFTLWSRHTSISLMFWIAVMVVIGLTMLRAETSGRPVKCASRVGGVAFIGIISVFVVLSGSKAWDRAVSHSTARNAARTAIQLGRPYESFSNICHSKNRAQKLIPRARQMGLSLFREEDGR